MPQRKPITHDLKSVPEVFQHAMNGTKTHEFRRNDRDFALGDIIVLNEYEPEMDDYSGAYVRAVISNITYGPDFGIPDQHCVFSFRVLSTMKHGYSTYGEQTIEEAVDSSLVAPPAASHIAPPSVVHTEMIDIVFDDAPSNVGGRFVEVEDSKGQGVSVGEWVKRPRGFWALRLPVVLSDGQRSNVNFDIPDAPPVVLPSANDAVLHDLVEIAHDAHNQITSEGATRSATFPNKRTINLTSLFLIEAVEEKKPLEVRTSILQELLTQAYLYTRDPS